MQRVGKHQMDKPSADYLKATTIKVGRDPCLQLKLFQRIMFNTAKYTCPNQPRGKQICITNAVQLISYQKTNSFVLQSTTKISVI